MVGFSMQSLVSPSSRRSATGTGVSRYRVSRFSADTRDRLDKAPAVAGRVHSVFERALNLLWHDGRLLTLLSGEILAAPFAAALSAPLPRGVVSAGAEVSRRGPLLQVGEIALDWDGAVIAALRISPAGEEPGRLARALERLHVPGAPALDSSLAARARRCLAHGVRVGDPGAVIEGACHLLGLGEGLTPAGDDCLVGVLAVLHRFRRQFLARHPEIGATVAGAVTRTTAVGGEFVRHALEGSFSEPVIDLITAPDREEVRRHAVRLLALGATSGADTILGMRLALGALRGASSNGSRS